MSVKSPRTALTLEQRVEVIRKSEKDKLSARKLADLYGVGRTQINQILKRKADVLSDYESNVSSERKRQCRPTGNEEINVLVWEWYQDASSRRINVTGPMLQEKVLHFASDLNIETFKASNGWLDSFKNRHNIGAGTLSGERGDVNDSVVNDWKAKLPNVCEGYAPQDIFNMDETGLFYRDSGTKTLKIKGSDCAGGKRSKERITVALCASMTGEKLQPLVIGKSKQPRCFNKIKTETLPVQYHANRKAWMNSGLFETWLNRFNNRMRRQGRKVLLFVDNAPSHPQVSPSNVKVVFLPANTTSKSQPMDAGIIQSVKLKYRKRQLRHIISAMDRDKTKSGSELLKDITILQAIYWISNAWKEVDVSTIEKCFAKCGFVDFRSVSQSDASVSTTSDDFDDEDDIPLSVIAMSRELFDCEFHELDQLDSELQTCDSAKIDWDKSANDILQEIRDQPQVSDDDDDDKENEPVNLISLSEAEHLIIKLKDFAMYNGHSHMITSVMDLEECASKLRSESCCRQSKISDFFKF